MNLLPAALPESRVADPADAPSLRWAILAPGGIAHAFADALRSHTRQHVIAVGSRSTERAEAFAAEFGIDRAYGDYRAAVDDPDVQAVYVAAPHSGHHELAMLAIDAGKHVLVEKAFARNASEAQDMVDAARSAGVTIMEAMWTRFFPGTDVIRQLIQDGTLGEVRTVIADHGQWFAFDPQHRLFNPDLAGGAVLDLGVYPISFASFALGTPETIVAVGDLTPTGVEGQVSVALRTGVAQASINTTLYARTAITAAVIGTTARAELAGPFYAPAMLTVTDRDGSVLTFDGGPISGHRGLAYEAAHFARLIADGAAESPLLPLEETLAVMRTMDEIRRQVGAIPAV